MHFKNYLNQNSQHPSNTNQPNKNTQYTFQGHLKQNNQRALSANLPDSTQFMSQTSQRVHHRNNDYSCVNDISMSGMNKSFNQIGRQMATPNKPNDQFQFSRMFESRETRHHNDNRVYEYKQCNQSPFSNKTYRFSEEDSQSIDTRMPPQTWQHEDQNMKQQLPPQEFNNHEINQEMIQKIQEQIHEIVAQKIEQYCDHYFQEILTCQDQEKYFDEKIKEFQQSMMRGKSDLSTISDKIDQHHEVYKLIQKELSNATMTNPVNQFEDIRKHLMSQRTLLRSYSKQSDTISLSIQNLNSKWEMLQVQISNLVNNNNILHSERAMLIKEEISKIDLNVSKKTCAKK